ncbi:hypothetical protein [Haloferax sp. Atlit-4N]|uniref:hypothetical protein n=1 Tax=Haloferax sp. Atlit-4N TaxID=2077206 RepID=UPI0011C0554D|nr:hypothetical protein [Haloferax sp. Atlit-4N]
MTATNTKGDLSITLLGVKHSDSTLIDNLEEYISQDIDVLYHEKEPEDNDYEMSFVEFVLRQPAAFSVIPVDLYRYIRRLFSHKNPDTTWDIRASKKVAEKMGIEYSEIGRSTSSYIRDQHIIWTIIGWVTTALFLFFLLVYISYPNNSTGVVVTLSYLPSLILMFAFMYRRTEDRNKHFINRIIHDARMNEYSNVCLVTGKAHLSGLTTLAENRGIEYQSVAVS